MGGVREDSGELRAEELWGQLSWDGAGGSEKQVSSGSTFFFFFFSWPHWVLAAAPGLSLVAASGGYSLLRCAGFSLRWLLLLQSTGSRREGFNSCGARA